MKLKGGGRGISSAATHTSRPTTRQPHRSSFFCGSYYSFYFHFPFPFSSSSVSSITASLRASNSAAVLYTAWLSRTQPIIVALGGKDDDKEEEEGGCGDVEDVSDGSEKVPMAASMLKRSRRVPLTPDPGTCNNNRRRKKDEKKNNHRKPPRVLRRNLITSLGVTYSPLARR